MTENLDPEQEKSRIIPFEQNQSSSKIILSNQTNLDLETISQNLVERAKQAETIEEVQKIMTILPSIEQLKERRIKQDLVKSRIQQDESNWKFSRKMEATKEIAKISASIAGVGIGLYLTASSPLLGPLFIILGLAGSLQYRLKDVSELLTSMISPTKDDVSNLLSESQKSFQKIDKNNE